MPKENWIFVDQKREETKHRTEWCAEANKYRCMRCGRGSQEIGQDKILVGNFWKMVKATPWRSRFGKKSG